MAEEVFRTIVDFEDYQVSNLGRVISNKGGKSKFLKPQTDAIGYLHVRLFPKDDIFGRYPDKRGKRPKLFKVHRLVAETFISIPETEQTLHINHKDGDKQNNHVDNLEWITHGDNIRHSWEIGLRTNSAEKAALSRYRPLKVISPDGTVNYYRSRVHCYLDLNVIPSSIYHFIKRGKKISHGRLKGYQFFDAPEIQDNELFKAIANIEEKMLVYKQTFNEYYKMKARDRREQKRKKQQNK